MLRRYKMIAVMISVMLCSFLSGCFIRSADELYALPEQSDDYHDLQTAIRTLITDAQYSSPVSGSNQQPVQMADLDGDGRDEAIVFANTGGARPLKVYILDRIDEKYECVFVIEGDGSAFDRVEYSQLDGNGGLEIVIGRQVSNQVLQSVSAYSFTAGQMTELLNANYSEFTIADLDQNGNQDLFLLRFDTESRTGYGELYRCVDGVMEREPDVPMSDGVGSVRHINCGNLADDHPAVFVGGSTEDGSTITDIFTFRRDTFTAISSLTDLHLLSVPVRGYSVYATDIDSDGFIEIPDVVKLPGAVVTENTEDAYFLIRWYNYVPSVGLVLKEKTYHNYFSGWFLQLPDKLGQNFIVSRGKEVAGSKGLEFYANNGMDEPGDIIFTLFAFSGSNRNTVANQDDRFVVGTKGETTFAAELGPGAEKIGLTQEELTSIFNLIRVSWDSGET